MMDCTSPPPVDRSSAASLRRRRAHGLGLRGGNQEAEVVTGPTRTWAGGTVRPSAAGNVLQLDVQARDVAPQLLEAVELAHLGDEDVDDHVEVVHEDPAGLVRALDTARQLAVVLLEALVDRVVDRLGLAVGVAGADDEEVGVARHAAEVEHVELDRLLVRRIGGGELGEALGAHLFGLLVWMLHGLAGKDDASSGVMLMMGYPPGSDKARAVRCTRRPSRAPGTGSDARRR